MTTSNFRLRLVYSFFLPLVVVSPLKALAADVRPHISKAGTYTAIVIEGEIAQGDFETFVKIVRENQGKVDGVYLFTAGGDFREAMKIGRAMRALELASQVPLRDSAGRPDCDWGGGGASYQHRKTLTTVRVRVQDSSYISGESIEVVPIWLSIAPSLEKVSLGDSRRLMRKGRLMPCNRVPEATWKRWESQRIFRRTCSARHPTRHFCWMN